MKRILTCVVLVVLSAGAVFAERNVLIDFSNLTDDLDGQNRQTMWDYSKSKVAGTFTAEQKARMRTSLSLVNWLVELGSSAQTVENNRLTYAKQSESKEYTSVFGIRVHFPEAPFNAYAKVRPPFEIPAYDFSTIGDDGTITETPEDERDYTAKTRFEDGYGVINNVGAIKSIACRVYGLNFPYSLSVIYEDTTGAEKTILVGYLNYTGWGTLTWNNPAYVQEVRARTMRLYPLYPSESSRIRFKGFLIQRDGSQPGGDFVSYIKDVEVIYDKADAEDERDINDEKEWGIRSLREKNRAYSEASKVSQEQVFRFQEKDRQATESFDDVAAAQDNE
jgi:hypothetical protein